MKITAKRLLLTLGVALCVGLTFIDWFWRDGVESSLDAQRDPGPGTFESSNRAANSNSIPSLATAQPIPTSADVGTAFLQLQALADAGDIQAACQLGSLLLSCERTEPSMSPGRLAKVEAGLAKAGDLQAANRYARAQLQQLEIARECKSIPASARNKGTTYLRQAALAGHPGAMLAYGSGHHLDPNGRGWAAGPEFDTWRRESERMIQGAVRAGHPGAVFTLAMAYQDDYGIPSGIIANDLRQGAIYYLLATRLFGFPEQPAVLEGLGVAELAVARREAERLHSESFQGKSFERERMFLRSPSRQLGTQELGTCEQGQ